MKGSAQCLVKASHSQCRHGTSRHKVRFGIFCGNNLVDLQNTMVRSNLGEYNEKKRGVEMESIQIKNLRCLKDTGEVAISPITVLVGKNSSGKSSFLRSFPLLKQSLIRDADGPFLWTGDENGYVDFGSFEEAVCYGEDMIGFSFVTEIDILQGEEMNYVLQKEISYGSCMEKFKYTVNVKHQAHDYVSEVILDNLLEEHLLKIEYDELGPTAIIVLNERYPIFESNSNNAKDSYGIPLRRLARNVRAGLFGNKYPDPHLFMDMAQSAASDYLLMREIGMCRFLGFSLDNIFKDAQDLSREDSSYLRMSGILEDILKQSDVEQNKFLSACAGIYYLDLLAYVEVDLKGSIENTQYIAPVRATAERYYRFMNLSVNELDYQGRNLAMYLFKLPETEMQSFQTWTMEHFGFSIFVEGEKGFLSLSVTRKNNTRRVNLSDVGFGYSQILPILVDLWALSKTYRWKTVFVIEQPELHLHPALQGKLVQAFIDMINASNHQFSLVFETHSKTFIEELGRAVYEKRIDTNMVNVIIFEKEDMDNAKITITQYDEDGYLNKWPIGFFEAEF